MGAAVSLQVDSREFTRKIGELHAWAQGRKGYETPEQTLRTEMRLLVERCIQATPPFTGARGGSTEARKLGEGAIRKDVGSIVKVYGASAYKRMNDAIARERARTKKQYKSLQAEGLLSYLGVTWTPENLAWARSFTKASGNAEGVVNAWLDRDGVGLPAHHQKNRRASDGRVVRVVGQNQGVAVGVQKYVDVLLVRQSAFNRYLKTVFTHVGRAKGGWNAAAEYFRSKRPAWVSRHGTKEGRTVDRLKNGVGFLEAANRVPYIDRLNGRGGILAFAVTTRTRDIQTKIEAAMRHAAERFNRK